MGTCTSNPPPTTSTNRKHTLPGPSTEVQLITDKVQPAGRKKNSQQKSSTKKPKKSASSSELLLLSVDGADDRSSQRKPGKKTSTTRTTAKQGSVSEVRGHGRRSVTAVNYAESDGSESDSCSAGVDSVQVQGQSAGGKGKVRGRDRTVKRQDPHR